jgi:hypothetical protein
MTAFLSIPQAVVDALALAPAIAPGRVRIGRELMLPTEWPDAIDVALDSSRGQAVTLDGGVLRWTSLVGLRLRVRAAAGVHGIQGPDALLAAVFSRLSGTVPADGAMQWQMQPDIRWEVEEADQTVTLCDLLLRVTHLTGTDLSAPA